MYDDENLKLLAEIRSLGPLRVGAHISSNDSGSTNVYSLGSFYSDFLDSKYFIAFKKYCKNSTCLSVQVACELGLFDIVENEFPHLLSEFPRFHGIACDDNGVYIGIITEDFSKGGQYLVRSMREIDDLPIELSERLGTSCEMYDLATTCFSVDGYRRIGDFGEFTFGNVSFKEMLMEAYFDKIDLYTVQVSI